MRSTTLTYLRDVAEPLQEFLAVHYPHLSEEARIGFAVQIALAHARGESVAVELAHIGGGASPN